MTPFRIRQTKTKDRDILTGIATSAVYGQLGACSNKECLAYSSDDGHLWENGGHKKVGRIVSESEVIIMQVDPMKWQIRWNVG